MSDIYFKKAEEFKTKAY